MRGDECINIEAKNKGINKIIVIVTLEESDINKERNTITKER